MIVFIMYRNSRTRVTSQSQLRKLFTDGFYAAAAPGWQPMEVWRTNAVRLTFTVWSHEPASGLASFEHIHFQGSIHSPACTTSANRRKLTVLPTLVGACLPLPFLVVQQQHLQRRQSPLLFCSLPYITYMLSSQNLSASAEPLDARDCPTENQSWNVSEDRDTQQRVTHRGCRFDLHKSASQTDLPHAFQYRTRRRQRFHQTLPAT